MNNAEQIIELQQQLHGLLLVQVLLLAVLLAIVSATACYFCCTHDPARSSDSHRESSDV